MTNRSVRVGIQAALVVASMLLANGWVNAHPTRAAKDAEKLARSAQRAEKAMQDAVDHVQTLLDGYNGILDGSAEDREASFKRAKGELADARKKLDAASRSVDEMDVLAEGYFLEWEAELDRFNGESVRQKSRERLDSARQRYATLADSLDEAGAAFTPLLDNLDDQLRFLGRDLSPESIAALGPDADALNRQADDLFLTVDALIARGRAVEPAVGGAAAD